MKTLRRTTRWLKDHPAFHRWGSLLLLLAVYAIAYLLLSDANGFPTGMLIIFPVLLGVWLVGRYAWVAFVLGVAVQVLVGLHSGKNWQALAFEQSTLYGDLVVLLIMVILIGSRRTTGGLRKQTTEQQTLLGELHEQTSFLALLGDIVSAALEAVDTHSILQVLANRTGELFGSDDCYITFWDDEKRLTLPQVAYGSLARDYQSVHQFHDGETTLTAAVMDKGGTIAIEDVKKTEVLSKNVAEEFPNVAALGLPLLAGTHKLGALILGFNSRHSFSPSEIARGEIAARQISLAITKAILLEEEQKRSRQLDTLLALANECTQASDEEDLIERATHLIGQKLYSRNFGIMMLEEAAGLLRVHPSYHTPDVISPDVALGQGVTGTVARDARPMRVGDVSQCPEYFSIDPSVSSELCVPILLDERLVGVINVESTEFNAFDADDEHLLTIMAGQLATAMGRLRAADASYRQAVQLARANSLIQILAQVGTRAAAAADPDRVLQTLGTELGKLNIFCLVSLEDATGQGLSIRYTSLPPRIIRLTERIVQAHINEYSIPLAEVERLMPDTKEPTIINNSVEVAGILLVGFPLNLIRRIFLVKGTNTEIPICLLPLQTEGNRLGYLWMWGEGLRESDLAAMSIFANQIASALQNASLLVRVQRLAVTDELTSLFNRRHFFDIAGKEFDRALENGHPLSALIIDLDDFKQFNDQYGHLVGDQVLRGAARLMQACIRARDVIGRYGGEEFSVLLPGTDSEDALLVARRFVSQVANMPIATDAGDLCVHLSIGIASLQDDLHSLNELINRADQAMYIAKGRGGDCYTAL